MKRSLSITCFAINFEPICKSMRLNYKTTTDWADVTCRACLQKQFPQDKSIDAYELLTNREREIVRLIAMGYLNKQICAELGISEKTVEVHRINIRKRAGLRGTAAITRFAISSGLIE